MLDRDLVERDGIFELYKKKTLDKKTIQKYSDLLELDYSNNKIQVSSYIGNLIQSAQAMMAFKKKCHQPKLLGSKHKSSTQNDKNTKTISIQQLMNNQNLTRFFYNMEMENSHQMFGFRLRINQQKQIN